MDRTCKMFKGIEKVSQNISTQFVQNIWDRLCYSCFSFAAQRYQKSLHRCRRRPVRHQSNMHHHQWTRKATTPPWAWVSRSSTRNIRQIRSQLKVIHPHDMNSIEETNLSELFLFLNSKKRYGCSSIFFSFLCYTTWKQNKTVSFCPFFR